MSRGQNPELRDESPKKPIRPRWLPGRRLSYVPRMLEWCIRWVDYWLSRTSLLKLLDKLGKLAILIAILAFVRAKTNEVWNAKSVAETKQREDVRKNIGIL